MQTLRFKLEPKLYAQRTQLSCVINPHKTLMREVLCSFYKEENEVQTVQECWSRSHSRVKVCLTSLTSCYDQSVRMFLRGAMQIRTLTLFFLWSLNLHTDVCKKMLSLSGSRMLESHTSEGIHITVILAEHHRHKPNKSKLCFISRSQK